MVPDFLVRDSANAKPSRFRLLKTFEFQHFPSRIDLQTGSDFSVIQNMAVFLKEITINALKSYEI